MAFKAVLAGVAVSDMTDAKAWYTAFFGRGPDRMPMPSDTEWDFGGSTLQVFEDGVRAGQSSFTLEPDDIEAEVSRLSTLGHAPVERMEGKFKVAIYADPDGNRIVLAQPA